MLVGHKTSHLTYAYPVTMEQPFYCINKMRIQHQNSRTFKEIALIVIPPRHMKPLMKMHSITKMISEAKEEGDKEFRSEGQHGFAWLGLVWRGVASSNHVNITWISMLLQKGKLA
ncbi:hypothetical protein L6452_21100 [Arctium lappa]|uniref:Uncharacterized protein n=1 Tax=Arctium lappa TaxID=4217 RepID=A0ACB9BCE5_ARCLA|nr:hypothetical protein L6452_21100 [Arctium lappa]